MSTIKVSAGERYFDRRRGEDLTVLDADPRLNQVLIEADGGAQEIHLLSDFLARLRSGRIVLVADAKPPKGTDEES